MAWWRVVAAGAPLLAAFPAHATRGSSGTANAAPRTKSAGEAPELRDLPARDLPIEPRHGLLGAPGAAADAYGPSRLGAGAPRAASPSYGEAAPGSGTVSSTWQSGDRVRSDSSADVRSARQQSAPDLELASEEPPRGAERGAATDAQQRRQGRSGR